MPERSTQWVARSRATVLGCWAVVLVLGVLGASRLPGLLTTSLAVPSTSSAQANSILVAHFGDDDEGSYTVVFRVPHATLTEARALQRRTAIAASVVPTSSVTGFRPAPGIVVGTIDSRLDLQQAASHVAALRAALGAAELPPSLVTGPAALQNDLTPILSSDLRRGELVAVLLALVLIALLLGWSASVAIPFVVAAATVSVSLGILYLLAHVILMVLYVPNVVALIGFGLAIDYSLLIVCRFREELDDPTTSVDAAIDRTMSSAGTTVVRSGVAVAVGLGVLLLIPVPFVRSLGVAGLVVPLVSIAAALTLQPALLSVLGRRARRAGGPRRDDWRSADGGLWARLARTVLRRPVLVLCAASIGLAAAALPFLWLQLTPGSVTAVPSGLPSTRGLDLVRSRVSPGAVTPIDVVVDAGARGALRSPGAVAGTSRLIGELSRDPEVYVVVIGSRPPYVDGSGRYAQTLVIGRHDFGDEPTQALVLRIGRDVESARFPPSAHVFVGGAPAQGLDFLDRVYGAFPWVVGLVLALAFVLLLRAFRSLALALLAVVLDVVTVVATYGILVVVFRFGVGADVLGLYRVSQLEGWVPVLVFALLFGLSMDYEVFFVSRMRESYDAGSDTAGAVTEGMVATGRVVTVAALAMVGALLGLVLGRVAGLQELGVGLAVGVVLDATVVRGLVLPSVLALLGPLSWWLPAPIARLVLVAPSPRSDRGTRA